MLPKNTTLIKSYDNKIDNPKYRFKNFHLKTTPSRIVTEISNVLKIYKKSPKSDQRKLIDLKMRQYIKSGFAVFLMGERGTGKTRLVEENKEKKYFFPVNCASFEDDAKAESELFGHKKGAFTGADSDKKGLFEEANGGILFLDEIHHLSKRVQAKLMTSTQTNEKNELRIRRMGDSEERPPIKVTLIFSTNLLIPALQKVLLPDFYDRITQLVIEIPPLRSVPEDISHEFKNVWEHMKFAPELYELHIKNDKNLIRWLKTLKLHGNYRDLQKIAIYYHTFLSFSSQIKKLIKIKTPFEFAKIEFEKYCFMNTETAKEQTFSTQLSVEQMQKTHQKRLANWAIEEFGTAKNAAEHFKKLGGKTSLETLYRWRNLNIDFQI